MADIKAVNVANNDNLTVPIAAMNAINSNVYKELFKKEQSAIDAQFKKISESAFQESIEVAGTDYLNLKAKKFSFFMASEFGLNFEKTILPFSSMDWFKLALAFNKKYSATLSPLGYFDYKFKSEYFINCFPRVIKKLVVLQLNGSEETHKKLIEQNFFFISDLYWKIFKDYRDIVFKDYPSFLEKMVTKKIKLLESARKRIELGKENFEKIYKENREKAEEKMQIAFNQIHTLYMERGNKYYNGTLPTSLLEKLIVPIEEVAKECYRRTGNTKDLRFQFSKLGKKDALIEFLKYYMKEKDNKKILTGIKKPQYFVNDWFKTIVDDLWPDVLVGMRKVANEAGYPTMTEQIFLAPADYIAFGNNVKLSKSYWDNRKDIYNRVLNKAYELQESAVDNMIDERIEKAKQ